MNAEPCNVNPCRLQAVVFDLDDTLYLERDYVLSGFRIIAGITEANAEGRAEEVFEYLWDNFLAIPGRRDNFDLLLRRYPGMGDAWKIDDLVDRYRCHMPALILNVEVRALLVELRSEGMKLAIITDGIPDAQWRKVHALGLLPLVDEVVVTDELGIKNRKPCPASFRMLSQRLGVMPERCAYVGDNPAKDFVAPRALGWTTVRLRTPGQLHEMAEPTSPDFAAHCEVSSIEELRRTLRGQMGNSYLHQFR